MKSQEINSLEHRSLIYNGYENKNYIVNTNGQIYSLKNKIYLKPNNSRRQSQYVRLYMNFSQETLTIHKVMSGTFPDLMSHTPLSRFIKSGGQLTEKEKQGLNLNTSMDHIDRNPHNNKINNLRFSTKTEQILNSGPYKNRTCIYKGVSKKAQRREDNIGIVVLCSFAKRRIPIVGCSGKTTKYHRVYSEDESNQIQKEFAFLYDETLKFGIKDHFSDHFILADEIINEVAYLNSNFHTLSTSNTYNLQ
jgi:hypothetical protein